jgi:hypothetical protein
MPKHPLSFVHFYDGEIIHGEIILCPTCAAGAPEHYGDAPYVAATGLTANYRCDHCNGGPS